MVRDASEHSGNLRQSRLRPFLTGLAFTALFLGGATVVPDSPLAVPVRTLLGQAPERLLPVVTTNAVGGSYRFTRTQDVSDEPVTFDPCRPVEVAYNPDDAPPGTRALVDEALAELSRHTGLHIIVVGLTDERPSMDRPASDSGRYGRGWSPVLLAWSSAEELPGLGGAVAGLGGGIARSPRLSSHLTYVSGSVTLDAPDLGAALQGPDGASKVRAILLHELAHLVGLDHVDDPSELMHPANAGQRVFGPGDLQGLARLGAGSCQP